MENEREVAFVGTPILKKVCKMNTKWFFKTDFDYRTLPKNLFEYILFEILIRID